jgi:hypothetical protein
MEACVCPAPAALTAILRLLCKENFLQLQRFIIQRAGYIFDGDTETSPNPITALSSWTPLFAASADTKVVSTPYVENVVIPRTEAATEGGGDNTTIDGIEIIVGANAVRMTGQIAETPSSILKAVRKLMCEPNLVWYGINSAGQIIAKDLDTTIVAAQSAKIYGGLPLQSPFVSDADSNGLNTRDKADFSFGLPYGWRDDVAIITPAFDAKVSLWPA